MEIKREELAKETGKWAAAAVTSLPATPIHTVATSAGRNRQSMRMPRTRHPQIRVYASGRRPAPATARLLTSDETAAALAACAARHPRAWAALKPVFETTLGARISDQETSLPMIALELAGGSR